MPKISELTAITEITDSDIIMITDAETSASKKITWANVQGSVSALESTSVAGPVNFTAQADVALSRGDVVYISGASGDTPTVDLARANSSSTMPAFGLAAQDIAQGATGNITTLGSVEGSGSEPVNTDGLAVNTVLYVSAATAGAWTTTVPSGETSLIQNIGRVQRSNSNNGVIKVGGAGRTNATPNLDDGNIFIGNGSGYTTIDSLTDALSNYAGIATATNETTFTKDVVQTPGSSVTPANNGDLMVEATSNTTLTFKLKGTDGVVRTGTITLS